MMLPNTLGKLWTVEFCQPSLKRDVQKLVKNVREAAIAAMQKTSWMSPTTRAAAAKKLRRMDIEVGWPDEWPRVDLSVPLSRTEYLQNMLDLAAASVNINIDQLRRGCRSPSGTGWSRPVYEVNAFYYQNENRFLMPAAILRYPYYDPKGSLAWNYGSIGSTIGHELCHAFDAEGREYDENGDKKDWWTAHDAEEYKRRANAVVNLYESRQYRGLDVNGLLTLMENIADLGGLEFAMSGFRAAVGRPLTKQEMREFFESYAISWRSKDRLKRAAELLATDPHSPPMLRVNHAVRQMDEWYEAFDIKEGCEGYIPPAKRIHFFS
jgi:putative endopeptidase